MPCYCGGKTYKQNITIYDCISRAGFLNKGVYVLETEWGRARDREDTRSLAVRQGTGEEAAPSLPLWLWNHDDEFLDETCLAYRQTTAITSSFESLELRNRGTRKPAKKTPGIFHLLR